MQRKVLIGNFARGVVSYVSLVSKFLTTHHLPMLFFNIGKRFTICHKHMIVSEIPIHQCHMPMPRRGQSAKSITMPVVHSTTESIDNKAVTRLFLPSPLLIQPLYHDQWVWMCITIKTANVRPTHMWKSAHGRHPPCQDAWRTQWSLMPERAVSTKAKSKHQSMTNIFFMSLY